MAGRATNMIDAPTRRDRVASEELAGEVRLKSPSKDGQLNPACRVPDCERTAGEFGDEPGNFECPHAVSVDREGTVFVSDRRKLPSGMMKMVAQLVGHDENEIGAIGHVFPSRQWRLERDTKCLSFVRSTSAKRIQILVVGERNTLNM